MATLSIRTSSHAALLIPALRKQITAAAPDFSVRGSVLLEDQIDNTLIRERLLAILAGFFSVLALLLSAIGLYGVIDYATLRRTREIGIRIALGARRETVVGVIVTDTALFVLLGVGAGIAAGLGLGRYLASQLFAVKPILEPHGPNSLHPASCPCRSASTGASCRRRRSPHCIEIRVIAF